MSDEKTEVPAANLSVGQQINNALTSPFAVSDIDLRLNTLFGSDVKQGAFVTSLLHVDAKNLKFTDEPNGGKKAVFDIVAVSFGDNGVPVDNISKTYTLIVQKEGNFQRILDKGFVYSFTFPVKNAGAYQYRVALRDSQTSRIGSANQFIEVPNLKKGNLTLSGVMLQNYTVKQWETLMGKTAAAADETVSNALDDTSLRVYKRGTILRYGYEIYNAKSNAAKADLTAQIRVFRDGKLLLDGKQTPLSTDGQTDLERIKAAGAINLGDQMEPGDYVLQIIINDNAAKEKRKTATQFVQFEIVE